MHCAPSPRSHATLILCATLLLGGCLQLPPPEAAALSLTKVNSARVTLWNVRLEKAPGGLRLDGHVFRHYPAADEDTTRTHLLVTFFDARGESLREIPAEFTPGRVPHGYRGPGYSVFSVLLDKLPPGTNRIQIRAYDEPAPLPVR